MQMDEDISVSLVLNMELWYNAQVVCFEVGQRHGEKKTNLKANSIKDKVKETK